MQCAFLNVEFVTISCDFPIVKVTLMHHSELDVWRTSLSGHLRLIYADVNLRDLWPSDFATHHLFLYAFFFFFFFVRERDCVCIHVHLFGLLVSISFCKYVQASLCILPGLLRFMSKETVSTHTNTLIITWKQVQVVKIFRMADVQNVCHNSYTAVKQFSLPSFFAPLLHFLFCQ